MRIHLKGYTPAEESIVIQLSTGNFVKDNWVALGYTSFEVLCIGGSGGMGGSAGGHTSPYDDNTVFFGGGGGGGGMHYVTGLLSSLASSTAVVIGAAGVDGTDTLSINTAATSGTSGGATTFGGTLCRASGGLGGAGGGTVIYPPGGQGGNGGTTVAGGGGLPGDLNAGRQSAVDGTYDGLIGQGGGGGIGTIATYPNYDLKLYTPPSIGSAGQNPQNVNINHAFRVSKGIVDMNAYRGYLPSGSECWPENGGGANAIGLTGTHYIAGTRHHENWAVPGTRGGACFIKLSA